MMENKRRPRALTTSRQDGNCHNIQIQTNNITSTIIAEYNALRTAMAYQMATPGLVVRNGR